MEKITPGAKGSSAAYVAAFNATKVRLTDAGATSQEMWAELEKLNLGRLRIAGEMSHFGRYQGVFVCGPGSWPGWSRSQAAASSLRRRRKAS